MPSQHAVLIVDADPKGIESLVYGFQGAEWRMTACPSPETASLLIKASGAQIVVVASRGEHERTNTLVRQLRGRDAFRALPILVLGPEELRQTLKESGQVDLLTLPTFVRDVLTASELLITAGSWAAETPGEDPVFQSPITAVKTLSLVRSMNGLARSGQMRLERNGRVGEIMFHQGELTAAFIGPLQGMAAVQHMMIWNDGKLTLHLRQVPRRGQLSQTAQEFLQEIDRFERDFAHGLKELGPAATVYSADQDRLKKSAGAVPAEVTPVVRLCNGIRTLTDIIDESPFRVLDTVRILGRLAELGILVRADGKPLMVTPQGPRDQFLENARVTLSSTAWPMPAPITAPPSPGPILAAPVPSFQLAKEQSQPLAAAQPEAAPSGVAKQSEGERERRRTLEIGVSSSVAKSLGEVQVPAAAVVVKVGEPETPAGVTPAWGSSLSRHRRPSRSRRPIPPAWSMWTRQRPSKPAVASPRSRPRLPRPCPSARRRARAASSLRPPPSRPPRRIQPSSRCKSPGSSSRPGARRARPGRPCLRPESAARWSSRPSRPRTWSRPCQARHRRRHPRR